MALTDMVTYGIIDWSDSCYGDIALDIAAIVDNYPIATLEPLLLNYEQKFSDRAIKRVLFYRAVSPLYYAHYMARTGNNDLKNYCDQIINGRKMPKKPMGSGARAKRQKSYR